MTNIVVALDGSERSVLALGWAQELAEGVSNPVFHLVHSIQMPVPVSEAQAFQYSQLMAQGSEDGRAMLQRAAGMISPDWEVKLHLSDQPPALSVLTVAKNVHASLIAVGSRGLGRAASIFLGSVSTEIVHGSRAPVLVAHATKPRPVKRILVGVDGSEPSARALATAAYWAPHATLSAMYVMQMPDAVRSFYQQKEMSVAAAREAIAEDVVYQTVIKAELSGHNVVALGAEGNPGEQLVAGFENGDYDLLVVGSRGLGTLQEIVLGSVSERAIRLSTGPVLVTK